MRKRLFCMISVIGTLVFLMHSMVLAEWKPEKKFIKVATAGRAGVWALIGSRVADAIQKDMPSIRASVTGGGGRTNPTSVDKGEKDFGISYADLCYSATQGAAPYEYAHKNIRHLGTVYIGYATMVVLKDSDIQSVSDLADKKISPSKAGFGSEVFMRRLLPFYDLSYDRIKKKGGTVNYLGYADAIEMMKDGNLDFTISLTPPGHPQFSDLAVTKGIRLLPIKMDVMEAFAKKYPGNFIKDMPKNPYQGVEGGFPIMASATILICNASLSDELVYRATKAIWQGVPEWRKTVASIRESDVKGALLGNQIAIHPGAEKYYREIGILK
jgi:TRAP transporter TAXI family solute receptor